MFDSDDFFGIMAGISVFILALALMGCIILGFKYEHDQVELEKYRIEYNIERGEVKDE